MRKSKQFTKKRIGGAADDEDDPILYYMCEYGCGYRGGFYDVEAHEKSCPSTTARAARRAAAEFAASDALAKKSLVVNHPPSGDMRLPINTLAQTNRLAQEAGEADLAAYRATLARQAEADLAAYRATLGRQAEADAAAIEVVLATDDYDAEEPTDLGFKIGDRIVVTAKPGNWWSGYLESDASKTTGQIPSNYVEPLPADDAGGGAAAAPASSASAPS